MLRTINAFLAGLLLLLAISPPVAGQDANAPEREQLLNGLRLLLWPKPGSSDLLIKLRIHSGAAFDLAGKSGQMALLGDLLFPDRATIEYFTEEMNGRLDVDVDYDSITISMEGKASDLERMIDILRNALVATQLTPDVVARIREARIKIVRDTAISPATVADRAVAARLFGDHPYGRPAGGSVEDLARVERADLMLARDRFLNSNNATLALIGGFSKPKAMRALRQLLGPWRKSEQIIPATFRQPPAPDPRVLVINGPSDVAELRLALRGVARSDRDYYAAKVLARLVQLKFGASIPQLSNRPVFARSEGYFLPGMFVVGASIDNQHVPDAIAAAKKVLDSMVSEPVSQTDMERARNEVISEFLNIAQKPDAIGNSLFDVDTYRLSAPEDKTAMLSHVTPADIQRVATRLFKGAALATVVLGEPAQLKTALQGRVQFEVLGEVVPPAKPSSPAAKPSNKEAPY